ncbi:glycoside hydrolase/phage tail family protein [Enterovirga sp.]|uniref:baseplate multidomain protein megatron n=1 Tax=Enterovirga sp. TaxID=2026350 RepID=UPI002C3B30FC|nr:glycoside hydrolase/phage tail family protein [Enterovirga sp.]HMO29743.1 glycoside hydrolase/phage tail family protein [Enterovirga sp.]
MSTLVLQAADKVVGGVVSSAASLLGSAVSGLFGGSSGADRIRFTAGPRVTEMQGLASQEGAPIPRLYGRARLGGQLIWATRFEEVVTTTIGVERSSGRSGGKSMRRSTTTQTTVSTTYSYYANLAIGLCEGPVAYVRRVWADGREVDLTTFTMRLHEGGETQEPDPLILAKEGAGNAPAYRGLAYVVMERLPLAPWGNRVPQFSFEVVRPVGSLGPAIRSVCLIPGATEFGYDPQPVARTLGLGKSVPENVHQFIRTSDVLASLDALQALCPNLAHVSVVASWFGTDLRAGQCRIEPRVDLRAKETSGAQWAVAGLGRFAAAEVSRAEGAAAYGGTPSDDGLIRLIRELKARGLAVTLYPFVMMDIPAGNILSDPWSGGEGQPAYPWRGRVTCDPAPSRPDTVDGTGEAATQVAAFFGNAAPEHFYVYAGMVQYAGPTEWSFRRLALHYATLAIAAGGIDAFVVGSELIGLTRIRSAPGIYPAVGALRALAADLRGKLGPATKLVYAADWTEYGAHVLAGGAEVRFPLDPLFADPAIDAVGIDYYPPLSDWRDGAAHLDTALAASGTDLAYLRGRLGAGEAFDWYYADETARESQTRTPITDGAYGKPWMFRAKDLAGWWSNPHVERVDGVETGPTAWEPGSKPIWLTETGIPAVDKGANAPNVFPDPKSSEGGVPPFSSGARDDLIQARALEAILSRFDPALPGHEPEMNPLATSYAGRMVDPARVSVWCWDARPYPAFPDFDDVWADGPAWRAGHWLNGRLEGAPLDGVLGAILSDEGVAGTGAAGLDGFIDGYVVDRPMSARDILEPLATLYGLGAATGPQGIVWRRPGGGPAAPVAMSDLVDEGGRTSVLSLTRAQETDLPAAVEIGFTDGDTEYGRAVVGSRRLVGTSRREMAIEAALVVSRGEAQRLADARLQAIWAGREAASFALGPRMLALEPGDVVALGEEARLYRIERIVEGRVRRVEARAVEPVAAGGGVVAPEGGKRRPPPLAVGPPMAILLDLPATGAMPEILQHIAVAADPWPGRVAVYRAPPDGPATLHRIVEAPAVIGRTWSPFGPGPVWRWDRRNVLEVELSAAGLSSIDDEAALAGGNLLAVLGPDGAAEIVSARDAELVGERRFRLATFLRGLGGTEHLAARSLAEGMTVVRLDGAPAPLTSARDEIGQSWVYRVGPAARDPADPAYVVVEGTVSPYALAPLAPVRVRARRSAAGIALSWVRRTRIDGDGWGMADVPLGEEIEAYEVEILSGADIVRMLATGEPALLYEAASEMADFGAPQSSLALRIYQLSRVVGRGRAADLIVPIL